VDFFYGSTFLVAAVGEAPGAGVSATRIGAYMDKIAAVVGQETVMDDD